MADSQGSRDTEQLKKKLDEIRNRLMANPAKEELTSLQLQMETIEQWARLSRMATGDDHQHNHMDDHDNTKFVEPFINVVSKGQRSQ